MFAQEKSIHIDAPPEVVYDYVSDLRRHPEWAAQNLVLRETGDGEFESTVTMGPLTLRARLHTEEADRPRRFVFVSDDGLAPHRWHFLIAPHGAGSLLKFGFERINAPVFIRIVQPFVMWPLVGNPGMVEGLSNIKRGVESATQSRRPR